MSERYQTIKIRKDTHRALKVLAAKTGESMLDLVDRLVDQADRMEVQTADKTTDTIKKTTDCFETRPSSSSS